MKHKDDLALKRILECAEEEFMEKGFSEASMRTIAEKAGYTTGMLYSRFADKSMLFKELVQEGADKLYNYFVGVEDAFADYSPQRQHDEMFTYVDDKIDNMIDIIYDYFPAFKLIVCKSAGSGYEYYIDKMVEVECYHTDRYIAALNGIGIKTNEIRADLNHMLATSMFNGFFEVVAHDLPKADAIVYVKQVMEFFHAGWMRLLGTED